MDYKTFLLDSRRDHVNIYNKITEGFRKTHLWLNGFTASAVFLFYSAHPVNWLLKLACIFLGVGTILSAFTYILEFWVFKKKLLDFDSLFYEPTLSNDTEEKSKAIEYIKFQKDQFKFEKKSINVRSWIGIACYAFYIFGVTCLLLNILFY